MPILKIITKTQSCEFTAEKGRTIRDIMQENAFQMPFICGGRGVCGKCSVRLIDGTTEISPEERAYFSEAELHDGLRLACTARISGDTCIESKFADDGFEILEFYKQEYLKPDNFMLHSIKIKPGSLSDQLAKTLGVNRFELKLLKKISGIINRDINTLFGKSELFALTQANRLLDVFDNSKPQVYGIAIDIGTTTICFELIDLLTGLTVASFSRINSQRRYGADVISRIKAVAEGQLSSLRDLVRGDVLTGIERLIQQSRIDLGSIYRVVIAANTTMVHILLDIPCASLGAFPFSPTLTNGLELNFGDVFGDGLCDCDMIILPSVSAYVGGDIAAGLFFCNAANQKALFVDIGTNCEMAVTGPNGIICASAAAGPAFEGGNISCGTGGVLGAISAVTFENSKFVCQTIGGEPAIGICGSGLMDAVCRMLENGMLDETGRLEDEYSDAGVEIAPGIILTQRDIRELQLAKSAMRAGIEILLDAAGIRDYEGIEAVYLAGSFGYNLNIHSAAAIGMIPDALKNRIVTIGNSALGGAARVLLQKNAYRTLVETVSSATELKLSESPLFNELFSDYMMFTFHNQS